MNARLTRLRVGAIGDAHSHSITSSARASRSRAFTPGAARAIARCGRRVSTGQTVQGRRRRRRGMCLIRQLQAFAGQRRSATRAEPAPRAGRGVELCDLALGDGVGIALEPDEHRDRRTAVPSAALAMAPEHARGLAGDDEAHRTANAAAFDLLAHQERLALAQVPAQSLSRLVCKTSQGDRRWCGAILWVISVDGDSLECPLPITQSRPSEGDPNSIEAEKPA
jgi:hypothetical protein